MQNDNIYIKYFTVACMLFSLPFIIHGNYYFDDVYRSVYGDGSWHELGRPLADVVTFGLSLNSHVLSDFYPLGTIVAVIFLVYIFVLVMNSGFSINKPYALFPLPLLFISPVFMQNMSYRYDSTAMIMALAIAIASFYFSFSKGWKTTVTGILMLIASLSLYQPCANIFLGLAATNLIVKVKESNNEKIKQMVLDCAVFSISFILYFIFVVKLFSLGGSRAAFINPSQIFESLSYVFLSTYSIYALLLTGYIKVAYIALSALALLSGALYYIKERPSLLAVSSFIVRFILCLTLLFFSIIGTSFLVVEGITDIRVMVGMSSVVFFLTVCSTRFFPPKITLTTCSIASMLFISLSFQYSNALKSQRSFELSLISNVAMDVNYGRDGTVFISGTMPTAPVVRTSIRAMPFIGRIVPPSPPWVSRRLAVAEGISTAENSWSGDNVDIISTICEDNLRPETSNPLYDVYHLKRGILVYFKGTGSICL
ncbi:glucosyltransferase domain-containing protein [Dryocola clanedunensis]